jgi:acyl-CoA synthetase (AMP-forming)/AMP-acid ligase II
MFVSFSEIISKHALARPEHVCFAAAGADITWRALHTSTAAIDETLRGTAPMATRVALFIASPRDFLFAFFGVIRSGMAVVPLPTDLTQESLDNIVRDCKPDVILADDAGLKACAKLAYQAPVLLSTQDLARPNPGPPSRTREAAPVAELHRPMTIVYSSGSTSEPKGIVHTYFAKWAAATRLAREFAYTEKSRSLVTSPLYSASALSPILAVALAGGTSIVTTKRDTGSLMQALRRERPTSLGLTPAQLAMLLDEPDFSPSLFESCTTVQSGGATLGAALRKRLFDLLPHKFVEGYGSTETEFVSRLPLRAAPDKRGSVGLPLAEVEFRILGTDAQPVPPGQSGEVAVASTANMLGYLGKADDRHTAFWVENDSGKEFLRTGDLGRIDPDGYLWLHGRRKDVIITGGTNIFPTDLESVLLVHPAVQSAAVVGVPHRVLGETPVAFVVLRDAEGAPSEARICQWANARLSTKQNLYRVWIVDDIPRNPAGKPSRRQLLELALSKASSAYRLPRQPSSLT